MDDIATQVSVALSQNNPGGLTHLSNPIGVRIVFLNVALPHDIGRPGWDWTTTLKSFTYELRAPNDQTLLQSFILDYESPVREDNQNSVNLVNLNIHFQSGQETWGGFGIGFVRVCHWDGQHVEGSIQLPHNENDRFTYQQHLAAVSDAVLLARYPTRVTWCR